MKILHTSDWHLGARLGRHDRMADQQEALRGLIGIAEDIQPDLVLHTGDVFDARRPPYEALDLGVKALMRLSKIAPTVVVCGNHDSPQLGRIIHTLAGMADARRLWVVTQPEVVRIPSLAKVAIAAVPFIPLTAIADLATGDPAQFEGTYADGMRHINDRLLTEATDLVGPRGVVLYAAHLFLHGARPGKSERRITVGEDYAAHTEGLHRAMYAALGHIHDPQLIPGGLTNGWYAGSLVPLDFGEATQQKVALIITIDRGDVAVEERPLPTGRPLISFDGIADAMYALAADGGLNRHILKARVHSDDPVPDLADRVLADSPDCAIFEIANIVARLWVRAVATGGEPEAEPQLADLFREWRTTAAHGIGAPHEAVVAMFERAIGEERTIADLGFTEAAVTANSALDELADLGPSVASEKVS
jgi:DNA repair protein SbcD/Mre11